MNIILIHLGNKKIPYILHTIYHLLYFKNNNIYLLSEGKILNYLKKYKIAKNINFVDVNKLKKSKEHEIFLEKTKLDKRWYGGFWLNTTERFFYIENFCKLKRMENIIHIENDNLIFCNLNKYKSILETNFNIGLTFLNNNQCIPSIIYFKNYKYVRFITNHIFNENRFFFKSRKKNDMQLLAEVKNKKKCKKIKLLPTLTKEMSKTFNNKIKKEYYEFSDKFNGIFDAAALGQKIDGLDKFIHKNKGSFINKENIFDPEKIKIIYKKYKKLKKPFIYMDKKTIPILNTHIHSKRTDIFFNKLKV